MKFRSLIGFAIGFYSSFLGATEYKPWFGNVLEIDGRAKATANAYGSISTGKGTKHRNWCDTFIELDASLPYREYLTFELEAITEDSSRKGFGMDSLKFTARQKWMNDITAEDPVSLTGGLSAAQVFKPGLWNLSSFHHGGIEFEAHVAVGKEFSCMQFWTSRLWGMAGIGVADMGSPWIKGRVAWEHNWCDFHQFELFVHTLWGLGHNNLHLRHFHGYGPVRHQCVDIGGKYNYLLDNGATIGLEYGYRVYGFNSPKRVSIVSLQVYYPFAL